MPSLAEGSPGPLVGEGWWAQLSSGGVALAMSEVLKYSSTAESHAALN